MKGVENQMKPYFVKPFRKKVWGKCLEFWENEKLNIIYLERARKSLSFFVAKIKERRKRNNERL